MPWKDDRSKNFLKSDGTVIPYDEMTSKQAQHFRDYIKGVAGLQGVYRESIKRFDKQLNYGKEEQKEAKEDDE